MHEARSVIESDHCPKCQVSWIGPRFLSDSDRGEGQDERYYSRIVCVAAYHFDAIEWKCPDCGERFNRLSVMPPEEFMGDLSRQPWPES